MFCYCLLCYYFVVFLIVLYCILSLLFVFVVLFLSSATWLLTLIDNN